MLCKDPSSPRMHSKWQPRNETPVEFLYLVFQKWEISQKNIPEICSRNKPIFPRRKIVIHFIQCVIDPQLKGVIYFCTHQCQRRWYYAGKSVSPSLLLPSVNTWVEWIAADLTPFYPLSGRTVVKNWFVRDWSENAQCTSIFSASTAQSNLL